ncbi:6-phosphogluconolactonase [Niveibacterium sp. 24ML]|uniref:6-phosphogluconolactonase n=1 Tax=Niveibacterium sp. 24ML TaxID=2985512 RepID=UPI00226D5F68|nr:6-phosphogluconolactonase [Niveibacterium sp. 24ML]MCX9157072.1 6-phosphogluconolactonase [Niveibacterium sp. 24ML]
MPIQLHPHRNTEALDQALAQWVAERLESAIATRGTATLVVSGGKTPLGFFRHLRERQLDWQRVHVTLADERWVPPTHPDSNERLVREHLLVGHASAATLVALMSDAGTPNEGARRASEALRPLCAPFDVVILGMGEDGHTASLFPDSPQIEAGLHDATGDACLATENTRKPPRWRISLTAPRLLESRAIAVHVTGSAKWSLLGEALAGDTLEQLPIRFALNQERVPCHVFWCR